MLGRILVFIAGMLVVALFSALLAPYFVDWTNFRQDFERQASLIFGKKVVVHGDVSARIIPFPSVTMTDVRVAQEGEIEPVVSIERFSMDMELAPFLSGEARIFEMRIEKPKVRLRLTEDGRLDWIRNGNPAIPAKTVVLENVRVIDGELDFEDRQTGRNRVINGLNMTASAKSLKGPWRFEGEGAFDGKKGSFSASTGSYEGDDGGLRVNVHVSPENTPVDVHMEGNLKMEAQRLRYRGDFSARYSSRSGKAGEDKNQPRASGKFELANDAIRLPEYRMEAGDPTDPYVITGEAALDTGLKPEFLLTAEGQQVDISRIGGGESAKTGRRVDNSAMLRMRALMAVVSDIPIPSVPGRASIRLPSILAGDTTYRNIEIEAEPSVNGWQIKKATAELPGRTVLEADGDLQVKGDFGFNGKLLVASNQPSGLAAWLSGSVDPAIRGLSEAGFSASVSLQPDLQRFEGLELAMGGDILRGRAERESPDDGPASLSVDLSGGELDIDAFKALSSLIFGGDAASTMLNHAIAAKLKLKALKAFDTVAQDVTAVFTLRDGVADISRLSIDSILGASVQLSGKLEGSLDAPKAVLGGDLKFDDAGELLAYLKGKAPAHPVMTRLASNSDFYAGGDLKFGLRIGVDGDWPVRANLEGDVNGTKLTAHFDSAVLGLTAQSAFVVDVSAESGNAATLFGQAGLQPLPIDMGTGGIMGLNVSRQTGKKAQIALTYTADDGMMTVSGEGDVGAEHFLDGRYAVALETDDIEPYLLMNSVSIPQMGAGLPLQFGVSVDVTKDRIAFEEIAGKADLNAFSGSLSLSRQALPRLSGSLSLDTLDLYWLAEAIVGPVTDVASDWSSANLPVLDDPAFKAEFELQAAKLWTGYSIPIEHYSGSLVYDGRTIGLQSGKGDFAGGTATGSVSVANAQGQAFIRTQFDVKRAELAQLSWLRDGDGAPVMTGKGNFSALLEASGASISQLVAQFSGSGVAVLEPLDIAGLDLTVLHSVLGKVDALDKSDLSVKTVAPLAGGILGDAKTHLEKLQLPFSVAGSMLRVSNVSAQTDAADLSLGGEADFAESRLDGALHIAFKPGEEALTGAEPGVTLDFSGPLADPSVDLDVAELASFLSLRAFEIERRRVELLQAEIMEKQRLRREVAYFKSLAAAREAALLKAEEVARKAREAAEKLKEIQNSLEEQGAIENPPTPENRKQPSAGGGGQKSADDPAASIEWNNLPAPVN